MEKNYISYYQYTSRDLLTSEFTFSVLFVRILMLMKLARPINEPEYIED